MTESLRYGHHGQGHGDANSVRCCRAVGAVLKGGAQAVWQVSRRLRRLETELAEARAVQADLRQRLERFEMIAAAAGAPAGPSVPAAPMPPELAAAARELRPRDVPVRLDLGGTEVVVVIGGEGDPREWWQAIWQLAAPARAAS
jgi:hypothetical protein